MALVTAGPRVAGDIAELDALFDHGLVYTHSSSVRDLREAHAETIRTGKHDYRAIGARGT